MFKTRKTPSLRKTPSVRGKRVFNNTKMSVNSTKPVLEQLFNMVYNKSYILRKKHTVQKRRNNSRHNRQNRRRSNDY